MTQTIQESIYRKNIKLDSNFKLTPMRNSQSIVFWKNHRVVEIKVKGKLRGWYGTKFNKNADEIIGEVKE